MNSNHTRNTRQMMDFLGIIVAVTLIPLLLDKLGLGFGSASRGGAGAHFAGLRTADHIIRFDINILAIVLFIAAFAIVFLRLQRSRLVLAMGTAMVLAGLADGVQIVPAIPEATAGPDYSSVAVWTTYLGRAGSSLILALGALSLYMGRRCRTYRCVLPPLVMGAFVLAGTWFAMVHVAEVPAASVGVINLLTLALYVAIGLLIRARMHGPTTRFLDYSILAALLPSVAGQLWLMFSVDTIYDDGFHIAVLLKWFSWLLPAGGLGIDFLNSHYAWGVNSEKRFLRSVIDAIPHFIFTRTEDGRFGLVNKAISDFYDLPVEAVEGAHLKDIHQDERQVREWLEEDAVTLTSGAETHLADTTTIDADGREIWIQATKKPLDLGENSPPQVLGVSIDITRQKEAEFALAQRLKMEQAAATIFDTFAHSTTTDFDLDMKRVLAQLADFAEAGRCYIYRFDDDNAAHLLYDHCQGYAHELGSPPKRLPAVTVLWMHKWHKKHVPVATDCIADLPAEAADFRAAWDTARDSAFMAVPILLNEEPFGFLGLDSDLRLRWRRDEIKLLQTVAHLFVSVWSRQEAERSLVEAMQAAQASSKAKSEFLANMSHEIRTPMNCVIGLCELLLDMDPTPRQREYLDMINQSGGALLGVINDILDLSKIEAGQLEIDPTMTDLRGLVDEVVGLIAFSAQAKGLEVVCRFAPGTPERANCDAGRLRQVLTNLLNNAAKFTSSGHIYLNVEPVGEDDTRTFLSFQVKDTGIGITPEQLTKIFEKFTQADTSTTRRFGGTGLGLAISQRLVELLGGELRASSVEGQGSTFAFTIPVDKAIDEDDAVASVVEKAAADSRQSVLLITGYQLSGEVLAEQVRQLGHDCQVALGTAAGLTRLAAEAWQVVLLDHTLVEDGFEPLRNALDKLDARVRPRIVLLTDVGNLQHDTDLKRHGFAGVLTKPVRPSHLARILSGRNNIVGVADSEVEPEVLPDRRTYTVLLAEDNPFNQKVAVGLMKRLGCEVAVAANGVEALDLAAKHDYDLVFMDCQMPEMDGYEATRRIRQLEGERSTVPVVAMTANALSGDRQACYAAGMDDFLSKPITKAMIDEMLIKWERHPQGS